MKQRWGVGFASDNEGLYVSLLELLVVQGGAQGLVEAVEVCSLAHKAGEGRGRGRGGQADTGKQCLSVCLYACCVSPVNIYQPVE
jgi:hypothetical protein